MRVVIYTLLCIIVVGGATLSWARIIRRYRRYRGKMLVTCPETHRTVGVEMDARRAAFTGQVGVGAARLKSCTRWPERKDCGQECLSQIGEAPEGCLVRARLASWYAERTCCLCGREFESVGSYDSRAMLWYDTNPGLRAPDGTIVEWKAVPVESLPEVMESHEAVCWDCMIADDLRRKRPDLVVERPQA